MASLQAGLSQSLHQLFPGEGAAVRNIRIVHSPLNLGIYGFIVLFGQYLAGKHINHCRWLRTYHLFTTAPLAGISNSASPVNRKF